MKFIENLGAWVLDHSWFTLPFAMISTFIIVYSSLPELAVVDGDRKSTRLNSSH